MIGWYAKSGVCNQNPPTNISDITFLDEKSLFTFFTGYSQNILTESTAWRTGDSFNIAEGQSALINAIGDDFYTIYCMPGKVDYINEGTIAIPSIFLPYENTVAYKQGTVSFGCIYIPTLSIVVIQNLGTPSSGVANSDFFSVSSDGNLTRLFAITVGVNAYNQGFIYFGLKQYNSFDDLLNIDNYLLLKGMTNDGSFKQVSFYILTDAVKNNIKSIFSSEPDFIGVVPPDDPYDPISPSGPGELPPGTFDDSSDPISMPSLPTISSANTGFTRIYNPNLSQVQALAQYLWTDETLLQTLWNHVKQYFENPMEAIIGFNLVPVQVPDGGVTEFKLMYIGTGVEMTAAASQFVDVDCGTLSIERYYASALDQAPYTKISCYLPYIGTVNLNTDEVMGTTLQVKYRVDICSGSCVAYILVDGNALYQYSGHCAIPIPISAADFTSYVSTAISIAKLASAALIGGSGAALAVGADDVQEQTNKIVTRETTKTIRNPETGRQITQSRERLVTTTEVPVNQSNTSASFAGITPANISNTVGQIMSSKPHIEHSGSFSGNSGYLGVRRPFVIIERPNICRPANYSALNGYPSMITLSLGECEGFTQVQQVQLTGIRCTNPELAEIYQLLKVGVIL